MASDTATNTESRRLYAFSSELTVPYGPSGISLDGSSVLENQPVDTSVGSFSTTDQDGGSYSYSIISGDTGAFNISGTSLRTNVSLDFEQKSSYSITVRATDSQTGLYRDETFGISVTNVNEIPTAVTLSNSSVAENAAGATVGTVSAADPDGGDVAAMAYAVSDGRFEITGSGATRTLKLKAGQSLDHEAGSTVSLDITATDPGSLARTETFTISVTDVNETPTFPPGGYAFSLGESSANTTAVGTVAASDVDAGQARTYAITAGNGTGGGAFAVHPTTGAITVADASQLNFETTQTFTLTVEATDTGSPQRSGTTTVTVTLRDVNERPAWVDLPASATAPELAAHTFGPRVGDPDTPAGFRNLTASIVGGGLTGMAARYNSATGRVDFTWTPGEAQDGTHAVTLRIADDADPTLYTDAVYTLTVNEVNQTPVLTPINSRNVNELQTLSFTVSAADADAGPGAKNAVTYAAALENGDPLSAIGAAFDPATRQFTWTPTEAQDGTYRVTFTAADNGTPPLADGETVTITVGEVNAAPQLGPIGDRTGTEGTALAVAAPGAADPDAVAGAANALTYAFDGPSHGASIDPATGAVAWTPADSGDYSFTVTVTDHGSPALSDSETFVIRVANVAPTPVITGGPTAGTVDGGPFAYAGSFSDPALANDSYLLTWRVRDSAGAVVRPGTPAATAHGAVPGYTFTKSGRYAAGRYTVELTVNDQEANGIGTASRTVDVAAVLDGITRLDPAAASTNSGTLKFKVSFSDPVTGLTAGHFQVQTTGTFASPGTASVAPDTAGGSGSAAWTVTVSGVSGDGDLYLTLLDTQGLTGPDAIAVAPIAGTGVDGERYGVDQTLARVGKFFAVAENGARYDLAALGARNYLPWRVKFIDVEFSEAVTTTDAALTGLPAGVTAAAGAGPGGGPHGKRWTLSAAVDAARLTLGINPAQVTDAVSNTGLSGRTAFALDVLHGDATGDGRVTADDLRAVQAAVQAGGYDPFADVDGNGVVNSDDYAAARRRLGTRR